MRRRLLVVTAVAAERDALRAGLGIRAEAVAEAEAGIRAEAVAEAEAGIRAEAGTEAEVVAVGVGLAAAAAGTARLLATGDYRAVLSTGIAGGFDIPPGGTVIGTVSVAADLGADSPDGFIPLSVLGFGPDAHPVDPALRKALAQVLPDAVPGPILSVHTVTGTAAGARALRQRYPDAVAEAMEGFGVASAAAGTGVPFAELRSISNPVGPRDRSAWRIGDALAALRVAGQALGKLSW